MRLRSGVGHLRGACLASQRLRSRGRRIAFDLGYRVRLCLRYLLECCYTHIYFSSPYGWGENREGWKRRREMEIGYEPQSGVTWVGVSTKECLDQVGL